MNYKELFLRYKKQIIVGVGVLLIAAIGTSWQKKENNANEIILPTIKGQQATVIGDSGQIQEYDYEEAIDHIGERAVIKGTVVKVFTSKSGVTFLDFCEEFSNCPFSAVIFSSDLKKFGDVQKLQKELKITGLIKSYNGKAEIILNSPEQVD